jgi:hypothetical protein
MSVKEIDGLVLGNYHERLPTALIKMREIKE